MRQCNVKFLVCDASPTQKQDRNAIANRINQHEHDKWPHRSYSHRFRPPFLFEPAGCPSITAAAVKSYAGNFHGNFFALQLPGPMSP